MSKIGTKRVEPRIAKALVAYICNYDLNIKWDKPEYDAYTHFSGSPTMLARVDAFIAGFNAGYDLADEKAAEEAAGDSL